MVVLEPHCPAAPATHAWHPSTAEHTCLAVIRTAIHVNGERRAWAYTSPFAVAAG